MLLVDDDQPEVGDGREHGRARPDADPRLAAAQAAPLVVALAGAEPRVQHRHDRSPKRAWKRPTICGVSAISGTSTIAPRPRVERRGRGPQVDLGLARAGDAVQQEGRSAAGRPGGAARPRSGRAPRPARRSGPARGPGRAADARRRRGAGAAPGARARPARGPPGAAGCRGRPRAGGRQRTGGARSASSAARWRGRRAGPPGSSIAASPPAAAACATSARRGRARRGRLPVRSRAAHEPERPRRRRAVLVGQPAGQRDEVGRDAGLERRRRLGEPLRRDLRARRPARRRRPSTAAPREGDDEQRADLHVRQRRGQPVVERAAQGARRGQRLDLGDRRHGPCEGRRRRGRAGMVATMTPHALADELGISAYDAARLAAAGLSARAGRAGAVAPDRRARRRRPQALEHRWPPTAASGTAARRGRRIAGSARSRRRSSPPPRRP